MGTMKSEIDINAMGIPTTPPLPPTTT